MNYWLNILLNAETDLKLFDYHSQLISWAIGITVEWLQEWLYITVERLSSTIIGSVERFQELSDLQLTEFKYDYRLQSSYFKYDYGFSWTIPRAIRFTVERLPKYNHRFTVKVFQERSDLQSNEFTSGFKSDRICSRTNSQAGWTAIRFAADGIQDDIQRS